LGGVLLLFLLASGAARADNAAEARAHYRRGLTAYDLGKFGEAAHEYEVAYELRQDPALLFNIGQAYRFGGDYPKAILEFKAYLRRVPDAPNRHEVESRILEMQRLIDQQAQSARNPPRDTLAPTDTPAEPPSAPQQPAPPVETPAPEPNGPATSPAPTSDAPSASADQHRGRTTLIAGLTIASVGIAATAVGIGLSVKAKQDSDELHTIDQQRGAFDAAKDSQGRAFAVAGPVVIGIGAAAAVVGGVVAIVGFRKAHVNHAALTLPIARGSFALAFTVEN
jgi:tetratricopeptide (TPR) repeat protein